MKHLATALRLPSQRMDRWRHALPGLEMLAWICVVGTGFLVGTQLLGWDGSRFVATAQALTPYVTLPMAVVAGFALWGRRLVLAASAAVLGSAILLVALPLVLTPEQPDPAPGAQELRVAAVNLLYTNTRTVEIADVLLDLDLDAIVFSEFTIEHADELRAHQLSNELPHQINRDGLLAGGMAVWSRYPLDENERKDTVNRTIDTWLDAPGARFRMFGVHPPTPVFDFSGWTREIDQITDDVSQVAEPTLVIGDFNASFWHPSFRRMLDQGLVDAHMAHGQGWSTSWPTDEFMPPFVRLDHALTSNGLVSTEVIDFRVPGSDHSGFVVTVALAS